MKSRRIAAFGASLFILAGCVGESSDPAVAEGKTLYDASWTDEDQRRLDALRRTARR